MPTLTLPAIARAMGVTRRRPIILRPIYTTQVQANRLATIYLEALAPWQDTSPLLDEYQRTASAMQTDSIEGMTATITALDGRVTAALTGFGTKVGGWLSGLAEWHRRKFTANINAGLGADLSMFIERGVQEELLRTIQARNVALVRSVSDGVRAGISDAIARGTLNRTPVREVSKEIQKATDIGKDRAKRIATDQTAKAGAGLDEARQRAMGFDRYMWRHSGKVHFRPEHRARDGKIYSWDDRSLAGDKPGVAPFCGCKAQAYIDLDD